MQGGWGAMGAGAWGTQPLTEDVEDRESPAPAQAQPTSAFGTTGSFKPNPNFNAAGSSSNNGFGAAVVTTSNMSLAEREAAVKKKEMELAAKERELAKKEKELIEAGAIAKKKNWPVCFPIWYHDIAGEVPERSRRVVREAYMCWWGLMLALTWQFFCATVVLGYKFDNALPSWFLTIIFWICGVPMSIWLWYKRIYNAAKDDSALGYIGFFIFFFIHWAWCVFCAIGLEINRAQWCFAGFINGIDAIGDKPFAGIIFLVSGGLWSALALYSMWVLKDAYFFFRGQGGVKEVKQKAAQEAALSAFKEKQGSNRV